MTTLDHTPDVQSTEVPIEEMLYIRTHVRALKWVEKVTKKVENPVRLDFAFGYFIEMKNCVWLCATDSHRVHSICVGTVPKGGFIPMKVDITALVKALDSCNAQKVTIVLKWNTAGDAFAALYDSENNEVEIPISQIPIEDAKLLVRVFPTPPGGCSGEAVEFNANYMKQLVEFAAASKSPFRITQLHEKRATIAKGVSFDVEWLGLLMPCRIWN